MLETICFAIVAIALAAPGLIIPIMSYRAPVDRPIGVSSAETSSARATALSPT